MNAVTAMEQDGIRQAINFYIDGLREGSVETLKQAFHTQETMCGYLGETLMVVPIRGFMISSARTTRPPNPASRSARQSRQSKSRAASHPPE
ncbi:MAG: nuclear transport factor 2 family protein [Acidobacteriota bacterium]|nr:nuclear transport factor 2 family protein [Acidobacteriota bacterium]